MKNFLNKFKKETEEERIKREEEERLEKEKNKKQLILLLVGLAIIFIVIFTFSFFEKKENARVETAKTSETSETRTTSTEKNITTTTSETIASSSDKDKILTKNNNTDLAHILTDPTDFEAYKNFVEKYKGQLIEFDGNFSNIMNFEDKKTRYNFLIGSGDYNANKDNGATFQIQNKNITNDLNLIGDNIPDNLQIGMNIHVICEILKYSDNDLIIINPIEISFR